jgi:hypothetical protein
MQGRVTQNHETVAKIQKIDATKKGCLKHSPSKQSPMNKKNKNKNKERSPNFSNIGRLPAIRL